MADGESMCAWCGQSVCVVWSERRLVTSPSISICNVRVYVSVCRLTKVCVCQSKAGGKQGTTGRKGRKGEAREASESDVWRVDICSQLHQALHMERSLAELQLVHRRELHHTTHTPHQTAPLHPHRAGANAHRDSTVGKLKPQDTNDMREEAYGSSQQATREERNEKEERVEREEREEREQPRGGSEQGIGGDRCEDRWDWERDYVWPMRLWRAYLQHLRQLIPPEPDPCNACQRDDTSEIDGDQEARKDERRAPRPESGDQEAASTVPSRVARKEEESGEAEEEEERGGGVVSEEEVSEGEVSEEDVIFGVVSGSRMYETRGRAVAETWMAQRPKPT